MALAIGLAPAGGAMAADGDTNATNDPASDPATMELSLDLLSLTDFVSNPTEDTWLSVMQQLRAHPCFNVVGEEREMCEAEYGLTADIETLLGRTDFAAWLRTEMTDAACGGMIGADRSACVARIPTFTETTFDTRIESDFGGEVDLTTSNESLFEQAGTAPTTREHALDLIEEQSAADQEMTPHERATILWDLCAESDIGQSGCYHTYLRFVEDSSINSDELREVIRMNDAD